MATGIVMINTVKNLFVKKRQAPADIGNPTWLPYRQNDFSLSGAGSRRFTSLGVVSMALRVYTDACLRFPLCLYDKKKQPVDHPILRVFDAPNDWQSKGQLFSHLVTNLFLSGNFHCLLKWDDTGQITKILPFVSGSVWAYPGFKGQPKNDFSDPVILDKAGYFYRDYRGRVFQPYELLHLKDLVYSSDLINGISRLTVARIAFESGVNIQESLSGLAEAGFINPITVQRPHSADATALKNFNTMLERFFQRGQAKRKRLLSVPEGFELKELSARSTEKDISVVKKLSDLDISKIFGLQTVFAIESGQVQSGAKEAYRALTHITLAPWLSGLASQFTKQLLTEREKQAGLKFGFDTSALSSMDKRELSTYLSTLKKAGIMTANESREGIGLVKHKDGDELISEPVEKEKAKTEFEVIEGGQANEQ